MRPSASLPYDTGRISAREGGNPNVVRHETKLARKRREAEIALLVDELRPAWTERMDRVTVHGFRHTHETWALAAGVDQVLINLHGGWSASHAQNDIEIARVRASMTGLTRYLDTSSKLLDSRKSPEAVRALLDHALSKVVLPGVASETATQA